MVERKRTKNEGFVGLQLDPDLLKKLDTKVQEIKATTGSGTRSSVVRMALIIFLNQ
jgi:hypothetical protein